MRKKLCIHVLLCAVGIITNFALAQLVMLLKLPVFLDSVGTVAVAAIGGALPGIIVGFITNIINSISDPVTIYYACINVMLAICSAFFASKGYFKKFPQILLVVGGLAVIGGGIGSILTWNLYGGGIGEGISAPIANYLYGSRNIGIFTAQLLADLAIDLVDKAITVLLVSVVLFLIPENTFTLFRSNESDISPKEDLHLRGLSLRVKVLIIISGIAVIITGSVTWIFLTLYHNAIIAEESKVAYSLTNIASACFDSEKVDEYMTMDRSDEEYAKILRLLSEIASSDKDIAYVYVYQIQEDGCHVVFDPDTEDTPGGSPGEVIPFDESFASEIPALLAGLPIEPAITNDTFGWLLTVYQPVYNEAGKCQCYVGVDIWMTELVKNERIFVTKVVTLFLGFFMIIFTFGTWAANNGIVNPINSLAEATSAFASETEEERNEGIRRIRALDIRSGDEIEHLYHSIEFTTEEIATYISRIQKQSDQISHMQSNLIMILADLVESRDKCTGNHVRNTATYTKMIMKKMKEQGIYAEQMTDQFIDDVGNGAPLHDVGKIHISDMLLNKPGRLTPEEFEIMKTHTTAGGEVIDSAMEMMGDDYSSYLKETKNLTLYHHERWDGKGYPAGLKGEDIPLSARIMAVADVFDALVARRSYKPGFPFEKAIDIIKEESGTHFDPKIVDAFLLCQDEAREVAFEANEKSKADY